MDWYKNLLDKYELTGMLTIQIVVGIILLCISTHLGITFIWCMAGFIGAEYVNGTYKVCNKVNAWFKKTIFKE